MLNMKYEQVNLSNVNEVSGIKELTFKVSIARSLQAFTKEKIGAGMLTAEFEQYTLDPDLVQAIPAELDQFFKKIMTSNSRCKPDQRDLGIRHNTAA